METLGRLNMQRFGRNGWFFLRSEDIPGVCLFGPDEQRLLRDAELAIAELLRSRGTNVRTVHISAVPPADSSPSWAAPTEHVAELVPA